MGVLIGCILSNNSPLLDNNPLASSHYALDLVTAPRPAGQLPLFPKFFTLIRFIFPDLRKLGKYPSFSQFFYPIQKVTEIYNKVTEFLAAKATLGLEPYINTAGDSNDI